MTNSDPQLKARLNYGGNVRRQATSKVPNVSRSVVHTLLALVVALRITGSFKLTPLLIGLTMGASVTKMGLLMSVHPGCEAAVVVLDIESGFND